MIPLLVFAPTHNSWPPDQMDHSTTDEFWLRWAPMLPSDVWTFHRERYSNAQLQSLRCGATCFPHDLRRRRDNTSDITQMLCLSRGNVRVPNRCTPPTIASSDVVASTQDVLVTERTNINYNENSVYCFGNGVRRMDSATLLEILVITAYWRIETGGGTKQKR